MLSDDWAHACDAYTGPDADSAEGNDFRADRRRSLQATDQRVDPSNMLNATYYCNRAPGAVVGRIMLSPAAPADRQWMRSLAYGHHRDRTPTHGYEPTRAAAMAAFRKNWRRES
jgi:hypothetical protein